MNPDTGSFMPMDKPDAEEVLRTALYKNVEKLKEAVEEVKDTEEATHPLVMTLRERLKVLNEQSKPPIFSKGEFLVIRGVAFRIGHITHKGLFLRPVRDQQLIDMVKEATADD